MFSMKDDKILFSAMSEWIETDKNDKVKFIIDNTSPTDFADENGVTLLHVAAQNGNTNIMEYLKDLGCELDVKDSSNRTPLLLAMTNEQWEAAKFLLKYNADIFAMSARDHETPLSTLIRDYKPNVEVLQLFFDKVKSKCVNKNELLQILRVYGCRLPNVIYLRDAEITEMFLNEPDADVGEQSWKVSSVGIAMRSMDEENMRVLLHYGDSVDHRREIFMFCLRNVLGDSYDDDSSDKVLKLAIEQLIKWKLLDDASAIIHFELIVRETPEYCLRKIMDDSLVSHFSRDLGYDIRLQYFGNYHPCVLEMVMNGEVDMNVRSRKGRTALHIATLGGAVETMEYLLDSGMDPNVREDNGKTPIFKVHYREYRCEESLMRLLQYKADLQATDNSGATYIDCYPSPEFSHELIKIVIAHLALLEVSGVPLKESFRNYVFALEESLNYFLSCCQQLEKMKTHRVHDSLTIFETLTQDLKNLIRRARSIDHETIDEVFSSSSVKEYDSYYVTSSTELLHWAVKMNDLRDKAAAVISDSIQVLKPYDLVIDKICSFLSYFDLRTFE